MFGIGGTELLVILLIALVVLGPKSLPKIATTLGKAVGTFRRVSTDFQRTINLETAEEEEREREKARSAKVDAENIGVEKVGIESAGVEKVGVGNMTNAGGKEA